MRKTAMLVMFALLAVAMVFAQNPANANTTNPQTPTQNSSSTPTTPDQNTTAPASTAGQPSVNQTTPSTDPNANQNTQPAQNNTQPAATQPAQTTAPAQNNVQPTTPQSTAATSSAPTGPGDVAAGTEIKATLDTPLSTKTSKAGDRFTATVTQPVNGSNGNVVIPAGARIEGEVSESEQGKALPQLRGKGTLNMRFRDVVLPNGQSVPLVGTLVSVNSTNGKDSKNANNEGQVESGTRGRDVAKDVGIGAGIGTVAGLIFGGPIKGLAIGAAAGGGYVLATKGKDVNLPAQTGMVIRLDQPLSLSGSSYNH